MEKAKAIEILMDDRCTKSEAEDLLKNHTIIFEDFEEKFDFYMKDWECDEEERATYKKMIDTKEPITDWGVVERDGHTYYIMYVV